MSDWILVCPPLHPGGFPVDCPLDRPHPAANEIECFSRCSLSTGPFPPLLRKKGKQLTLSPSSPAPQSRELHWHLRELGDTLSRLKRSLEDCDKLLGPSGRGNTLVVSTPRNEVVKGHVTRLGTQIVKGTIHLKLRTLPPQTLTVDPSHAITIAPLDSLSTLLTNTIDLLDLTLATAYRPRKDSNDTNDSKDSKDQNEQKYEVAAMPGSRVDVFIAVQLRALSQALRDASALLQGPPLTATDPLWKTQSAELTHFSPPLPSSISFYIGLQESQLALWLRVLEPADMPVNLGMKFALALGTARRLDHDEADQVFTYCCEDGHAKGLHVANLDAPSSRSEIADGPAEVYVREKVRVESADPNLLSLSAKLVALNNVLFVERRNLAAVMGEEFTD